MSLNGPEKITPVDTDSCSIRRNVGWMDLFAQPEMQSDWLQTQQIFTKFHRMTNQPRAKVATAMGSHRG